MKNILLTRVAWGRSPVQAASEAAFPWGSELSACLALLAVLALALFA